MEMTAEELMKSVYHSLAIGEKLTVKNHTTRNEKEQAYTVLGFYPNYVLMVNELGFRECFSYWETYQIMNEDVDQNADNVS